MRVQGPSSQVAALPWPPLTLPGGGESCLPTGPPPTLPGGMRWAPWRAPQALALTVRYRQEGRGSGWGGRFLRQLPVKLAGACLGPLATVSSCLVRVCRLRLLVFPGYQHLQLPVWDNHATAGPGRGRGVPAVQFLGPQLVCDLVCLLPSPPEPFWCSLWMSCPGWWLALSWGRGRRTCIPAPHRAHPFGCFKPVFSQWEQRALYGSECVSRY